MSLISADGSVLSVEAPPHDKIAVVMLPCVQIFNWSASVLEIKDCSAPSSNNMLALQL